MVVTSTSTSIKTPISITASTAPTFKTCRRAVRDNGSTPQNTEKASPIETRARRKNLIGRAHPIQLSRAKLFVAAQTKADKISPVAERAIVAALLTVEELEIAED